MDAMGDKRALIKCTIALAVPAYLSKIKGDLEQCNSCNATIIISRLSLSSSEMQIVCNKPIHELIVFFTILIHTIKTYVHDNVAKSASSKCCVEAIKFLEKLMDLEKSLDGPIELQELRNENAELRQKIKQMEVETAISYMEIMM
jgi:hypothetical protein